MKLIFAILILLSPPAAASDGSRLLPESRLWLEGNSNVHPYSSQATKLEVQFERVASSQNSLDQRIGHLKRLELTIPVNGLKSGKSALDRKMVKALKGKESPSIVFHLGNYQVLPGDRKKGNYSVQATGDLTIAGRTEPITLTATVLPEDDRVTVTGSKELLMSEFGVDPPTALLGALKTKDKVMIHFELHFQK